MKLGVSRSSIRRAIEHLEGLGVVYKIPNQGIFVDNSKININLTKFTSFTSQMKNKKLSYGTKVVSNKKIPASNLIAKQLNLNVGENIFQLVRLREINGNPFSIQTISIPIKFFPKINDYDYSKESLYSILENIYNTKIIEGIESIGLVMASPKEAEILKTNIGDSLLYSEGINFDNNHTPIEFVKQVIISNRIEYQVKTSTKEVEYDE